MRAPVEAAVAGGDESHPGRTDEEAKGRGRSGPQDGAVLLGLQARGAHPLSSDRNRGRRAGEKGTGGGRDGTGPVLFLISRPLLLLSLHDLYPT